MERNKTEKGKEEENRERQRLSSFLLIEPDSLEINLLELITAQIQLTEVPVHFEAAWHLPEAEHREKEREEVVLPSLSQTGSVQHSICEHTGSFSKTGVTILVSTRHAQPVRLGNCKYSELYRLQTTEKNLK